MPINRVAYFAQTVTVTPPSNVDYVFPVQSANIDVTRPIEAITTFGQFSSLNTAQTNLTTCKSTIKGYLGSGSSGISGLTATAINDIISGATGLSKITVSPGGFTMTGIITNLGIDIAMGGFGMFDMGFAGVGNPTIVAPSSSQTSGASSTYAIAPITTMSIGTGGGMSGAYATSIKFSYDLPTDVLSALGDNPNANQGNMNSTIATKAPYKTSISIEGHGVDPNILDATTVLKYSIGDIGIVLPHGKVNARAFNNAAGQVSASFSYSAEDTSATFTAVGLSAYTQSNGSQGSPTYGA
jgi:hypothetical protein